MPIPSHPYGAASALLLALAFPAMPQAPNPEKKSSATPPPTSASASASARADVLTYRWNTDDLDNGLRLITIPTDFPNIVSVYIVVATGSRNEVEEGKSGFAHFFEHMMFRGTKKRSSAEQAAVFKRIGAARNAYTTDDYTAYHTTFGKEDLGTVLELEADRFQNLHYAEDAFRTEARAVLGEYNKNSANPVVKLMEVLRERVFTRHTYEHTTMGFLRDIEAMPEGFEYSRQFFDRWYRPEHTTILVVGDVEHGRTLELVKEHFGSWQRGSHRAEVPAEPPQQAPITMHVPWPSPTQPWVVVSFRGPAFDPDSREHAALDLIASLAFSPSSELYQKLFVRERKVDVLSPSFSDHRDPYLLQVFARAKDVADLAYVRDEILATCRRLQQEPVDPERLEAVKANVRYGFAAGLDSSQAIASALARYVGLSRDVGVVNRMFRSYAAVTPQDVQAAARKWFVANARTVTTLAAQPKLELPPVRDTETTPAGGNAAATSDSADRAATVDVLALPSSSPLVSFRLLFLTGSADDPKGKEGLAWITAQMLAKASTRQRSYEQILQDLFPMAASVDVQVDKEMTVFSGTVHRDNLQEYQTLLQEMLTQPKFDGDDLARVKNNTISFLDTELRRSNDEELGKEVLYQKLYAGSYEHHSAGTIGSVKGITVEDVKAFYESHFRSSGRGVNRVTLGLAGGAPDGFASQAAAALAQALTVPGPKPPDGVTTLSPRASQAIFGELGNKLERSRMTIVKKQAMGTGIHIGFPIEVTRGDPDWVALWLVRSWLGEHRSENSHLYQRLREIRGLNYGDYAYIEYFPRGMYQFQPDPNLARRSQIFQIWVRPVVPENGPFALRAALYELRQLVANGLTQQQFEATREYLRKGVDLLVQTDDRRLGYALDSAFYGIPEFTEYVKDGLAKLTLEHVNRAIREHLRGDRLQFVVVTQDAEGFAKAILGGEPTPPTYQTEPAADVLAEDEVIAALPVGVAADAVEIVPVEEVLK